MPFRKLAAVPALLWLGVALAAGLSPPSSKCQRKCGGVDIPYPFGIVGPDSPDNCAMAPDFSLTCNETGNGDPRPFYDEFEVVDVSLQQGQARMRMDISSACYNTIARGMDYTDWGLDLTDTPYTFSDTTNKFTVIGCQTLAYINGGDNGGDDDGDKYMSGCVAMCRGADVRSTLSNGSCSGIGCCQTAIPKGMKYYSVSFDTGFNTTKIHKASRCSYAVLMDSSNFTFLTTYATSPAFNDTYGGKAPFVVDWAIGNERCDAARKKPGSYACVSDNSECFNSLNGPGYICNCSKGFQGNPYLQDQEHGCKDINECTDPGHYPCLVPGTCQNIPGGFECRCPKDTKGNAQNGTCQNIPGEKLGIGLLVGLPVGGGISLICLVPGIIFIMQKLKARRAKRLREKYFKQNWGLLLQQLVDKDIAERMIFSLEELEKATNKFDEARKLGGGGHGVVYKGILSNQDVVAIKKSKITIQREIDDFINEVAILSQINHRNVVRLFGCCLETQVPLLVYEFISNGTLSDYLHVEDPQSLSWGDRLRIALETASALAYLHSSALTSIIHRDVKSANILLGDRLIAKVSDFGSSRGIPIDQTGVKTAIQGTFGYLDPEYYQTSRLTDKSDVYSFGVILVELLTRTKPSAVRHSEGVSLIAHFNLLVSQDKLCEILDPQVISECLEDAKEVAALASTCLKMKGEERPTMRQVEMALERLLASNKTAGHVRSAELNCTLAQINNSDDNNSRQYSAERELLLSASFPR